MRQNNTAAYLITCNDEPKLVVMGNVYMAEAWKGELADALYTEISGSHDTTGTLYEQYCEEYRWDTREIEWRKDIPTNPRDDESE